MPSPYVFAPMPDADGPAVASATAGTHAPGEAIVAQLNPLLLEMARIIVDGTALLSSQGMGNADGTNVSRDGFLDMTPWEVATSFYPDLRELYRRLSSLSRGVADAYAFQLLHSRAFDDRNRLAADLESRFIDDSCQGNAPLAEYVRSVLRRGQFDAAGLLFKYIEVIGAGVDVRRFEERLNHAFPSLRVFKPDHVGGTVAAVPLRLPAIHRLATTTDYVDQVEKLKASWAGRLYARYVKPRRAMRRLAIWLWRSVYPLYLNHLAGRLTNAKSRRWHALVRQLESSTKGASATVNLAPKTQVETPAPRAFPVTNQAFLVSPHASYVFPDIYVTEYANATVFGGTNLIHTHGAILCHDLYDFERDYTSEELHGRTLIDPVGDRIRWLMSDPEPEQIAQAAAFVDACAPNYAHWLTEILPRIALFCGDSRFSKVPIVINDGLHRNIMESLVLVTGSDRQIIAVPVGRALEIQKLFLTSVAGYVPFERRPTRLTGHSHGMFSPAAFAAIRRTMQHQAGPVDAPWPEKIYIRRNSGARKVTNAAELENLLVGQGYVVVEPERLSFVQQVQVFQQARVIVGSSGAAMANIIFAAPGTRIVILISKFPDTSYWYWQNIAVAAGNQVVYVLGESVNRQKPGIHDDYVVAASDLSDAISLELTT